jgi:hypothetical protein
MWKFYGPENVAIGCWGDSREHLLIDRDHGKAHAVVKTHEYASDRPDDSIVIHSTRNYREAIASWRKMNPRIASCAEDLRRMDYQWRPHAALIIHRVQLDQWTLRLLAAVNICRAVCGMSYADAVEVFREVDQLRAPEKGSIDPVTLLHRGNTQVKPTI